MKHERLKHERIFSEKKRCHHDYAGRDRAGSGNRRVSAPKGAQTQSSASLSADASGWAKKNYAQYEDFLDDDADLFDDDAIETFAKYDAQLDYGYGSILGLVSTDSLDGKSMEDYAMDASADLELGDSDMLLLIDTDTEQWYLAYGGDMADYVDNDLSILFRQNLGSLFTGSAEKSVTGLYQDLLGWYAENIPAASGNAVQPEPAYVQKEESGIDLFGSDHDSQDIGDSL